MDIITFQNEKTCNKKACICNKKTVLERFKYFEPVINELIEGSERDRKKLIKDASPCFLRLLCEVLLNVLKGNIELSPDQYKELRRHRRILLPLCESKTSTKKRRKFLVQRILSFLPKILPAIIGAISAAAARLIVNTIV